MLLQTVAIFAGGIARGHNKFVLLEFLADQTKQETNMVERILKQCKRMVFYLSLHVLCFSIYAIPMFLWNSPQDRGKPVLDELHIVSLEQKDIYPERKITTCDSGSNLHDYMRCLLQHWIIEDSVWTNDYWGRPMTSPSSHKSWRPLAILSFRYFRFPAAFDDLVSHRLVNAILHTFTGELAALLAIFLLAPQNRRQRQGNTNSRSETPSQVERTSLGIAAPGSSAVVNYRFLLYALTKLLFCLHPTHVEVTANAANRPHLIATAAICLLSNPQLPYPLFVVVMIIGFLSSETFLFGVAPATVTSAIIQYRWRYHWRYHRNSLPLFSLWSQCIATLRHCLLRILTLLMGSVVYYLGRKQLDWLNIPSGLVRPAENPYFRLVDKERFVNYAYVTALHIAKSWDLDWVGFSHEYGYKCLTPIESFSDLRLVIPSCMLLFLLVLPLIWFVGMGLCVSTQVPHQHPDASSSRPSTDSSMENTPVQSPSEPSQSMKAPQHATKTHVWSLSFLLWLFHLSWLVTLFPIMGIVKVGTFVADRIVVTSSVSVCILLAHFLASWLTTTTPATALKSSRKKRKRQHRHSSSTSFPFLSILPYNKWRCVLVVVVIALGWRRIHLRTWDWMDSYPLLTSSLKTCPRSAKSHLEISKIYSGLYPDHYNLTQARWHLQQVEEIDPTYCDIHYQFAHVALQEQELLEVEERLAKSIPCKYTMGGAMALWKRYWSVILGPLGASNPVALQSAQERQRMFQMQFVQEAMEAEEREKEDEQATSHFASWRGK